MRAPIADIVELVPSDRRQVAEALAEELAFMAQTLERLRAHVAENGPCEWYENGSQQCWRESPALKSYNTTVSRYSLLFKQLVQLIPEGATEEGDELDEWLKSN